MSRSGVFFAALAAMTLCATFGRLAADKPKSVELLPEGTKNFIVRPSKDRPLPEAVRPGKFVDVVCEISKPVETGIALLNVQVTGIDSLAHGDPPAMTVRLTPAQGAVLKLMEKHGAKLSIRLHQAEKPKPKSSKP